MPCAEAGRVLTQNIEFADARVDQGPGRAQMSASASGPELSCLRVELASFGFSHKAPEGIDTDSIFDLRALPNPKSYAAERV